MTYHLRELRDEERQTLTQLSQSQTASARLVARAQMVRLASTGRTVPQIARELAVYEATVRV